MNTSRCPEETETISLNRRFGLFSLGRREDVAGRHGEGEHRDSAVSMATTQR